MYHIPNKITNPTTPRVIATTGDTAHVRMFGEEHTKAAIEIECKEERA